jgi:CTD small phosphatase-like protein 2
VLDLLDPNHTLISHKVYRESCLYLQNGIYVKDLRIFGDRELKDLVIIDNSAYSFGYQIDNGIPIIPFYDNYEDEELRYLIPYLKKLAVEEDCRDLNRDYFKIYVLGENENVKEAVKEIY